jgi:DNA-binding PadR family transcriptional regulator
VLELAVLGLLHESPMHGYELRKRLNALLGMFRAFSYGSLYPCLKQLLARGLIVEDRPEEPNVALALQSRRSKIVYKLTADGKERLQQLLAEAGPAAWEDEGFGVRFAFFSHTRADVRLRILEGRRSRLEERLESVRAALARTRERVDSYTLELQNHGLESVEREVRWLNELIGRERAEQAEQAEQIEHARAEGAGTTGRPARTTSAESGPQESSSQESSDNSSTDNDKNMPREQGR